MSSLITVRTEWDLDRALEGCEKIDKLLKAGWEPFAAEGEWIWLRRKREVAEET